MVDPILFRAGMARLGAAVCVISTDGPAGRRGFTASAVCSVTDEPPTLIVCVNRSAATNAVLKANGVLSVNVLTGQHIGMADLFARSEVLDRFADDSAWTTLFTGAPALRDALASLDCRISEVNEIGTHSVFFCQVESMRLLDRMEGLVYFDRCYHRLSPSTTA
jgi:flavin reductase